MAKGHILPIFVPHLGCPHHCVFCDQKSISGALRIPSGDETAREIEKAAVRAVGVPEVAFYGGSFTAVSKDVQRELLEAAAPFLREGRISGIRISTRPDCIDEEILRFLEKKGVKTIELGVQSMDGRVLAASGRGHTAEAVRNAAELIRRMGFSLVLQVMCGLPGDTRAGACYTAEQAAALRPDAARIYPVVVVRHTPLAAMMEAGVYAPLSLEEAVEQAADMLEIFDAANIPVLRIGLQPTGELAASVCAGPYHPALGEMVKSRVWLRRMEAMLEHLPAETAHVRIAVPPRALSAAVGQKRENLRRLKEKYPKVALALYADSSAPGKGRLES